MGSRIDRADFVMLQHLQHAWNRAIEEHLDPQLTIQREERGFAFVRRYDPSGGRYHGWLAAWRRRLWNERGFLVTLSGEELLEVRAALAHFDAVRDRLSPELRDVGQYHNPRDLKSTVPSRIAQTSRRKEAERMKGEAHRQSQTLFHEGDWRAILLEGPVAARFWGLGTRWCTTSAEDIFWRYARLAPLIVFVTPRGRYQMHLGGAFKDAADRDFDRNVFNGAPAGFLSVVNEPSAALARAR